MTLLAVWAPTAQRVDAVLGERRVPMARARRDGWFEVELALAAGQTYAFSVDNGPARPDPRSRFQPGGVHAPSAVVELPEPPAGAFRPAPLDRAVIYELHVGTFSAEGTFDGAVSHLSSLVELGVTHVELMPVAAFPGVRGWGYDGVAPFATHAAYGGPEGLVRFVRGCHERGLGVILDVVYNHLGPSGNYLATYAPYFTSRYGTPWGDAVNFDGPKSDEVRAYFVNNALAWLRDYGIDGLRLDAVHAIFDGSAVHVLEELATAARAFEAETGRSVVLIAESDLNDPKFVRPTNEGGYGLDATWSDDLHHALHVLTTGERTGYYEDFGRVADVAKALRTGYVYDGVRSHFRGRRHGRPSTGLSGTAFVVSLQNHDQVGNRAQGDRLSHTVGHELARVAAALVLLSPFVPLIFQGEEWGASTPFPYFTDHGEPELARAVSEGRREEFVRFGWDPAAIPDPQAPETFERARLCWDERSGGEHAATLAWYRALLRLRREQPELADPRLELVDVAFDERSRWLLLRRGSVGVVTNFGDSEVTLPLGTVGEPLAVSKPGVVASERSLSLPGRAAAVVRLA